MNKSFYATSTVIFDNLLPSSTPRTLSLFLIYLSFQLIASYYLKNVIYVPDSFSVSKYVRQELKEIPINLQKNKSSLRPRDFKFLYVFLAFSYQSIPNFCTTLSFSIISPSSHSYPLFPCFFENLKYILELPLTTILNSFTWFYSSNK